MSSRSKKKKGNKILLVIIIVMIILIGLSIYYSYYKQKIAEENKVRVTLIDDVNIQVNEEYKLSSLVEEIKNGELINGEEDIDTSKIGNIPISLMIKNKDDIEEEHVFNVSVVDTIKPEIEAKAEITSYVGNDIDLLNGVSVKDNSKEEIKATVLGEYDKNKVGEYNLKYSAKDSSGNEGEYAFVLKIISDPNNRVFTTSKGYLAKVSNGLTYIDGVLIVNKTYALPSNYGNGLTGDTQNAFSKLQTAALTEGISLRICSGYRSYSTQKYLYNNYVSMDGKALADTYSARPGHSEHQSGLAIDINMADSAFNNSPEAKWLNDNAYKYGFILRYPKGKDNITGYMYESWHFRYVGTELANKLYNDGNWITLEEYFGIDSKYS